MQQITGYGLSPQQRRIWNLQQVDGSASYRALALLAVEGDLHAERFKTAVEDVASRYEILRTSFLQLTGRRTPLQVISDDARPLCETVDLQGTDDQSATVERLWEAERLQELMPQSAVLRAKLVLLSDRSTCLLLSVSSLCADARTLQALAGEIGRAYSATGQNEDAVEAPLQYADLSEWQNELLASEDAAQGKDYWRDHYRSEWFAHATSLSRTPVTPDSPNSFDHRVLSLTVDARLGGRLNSLPLYRTSPEVALLSCWQILLWHLGGRANEVFVAVAHDGREYDELRNACGLFERYLPVACGPQSEERWSDTAERLAQTLRETKKWQKYFSWAHFDESEDTAALFLPYAFDYESNAPAKWQTPSATLMMERQWVCTDRFSVKLRCVKKDNLLVTEWHYDGGVYRSDEIGQLAERYHKLLASLVDLPQSMVGGLTVLTDHERQQLLVEWNDTETDYPRQRCVHELFEAQAARTPDHVAIVCGDERLTYAALNARANQLGRLLREWGVGPEVTVGVLMERSIDLVVSLLGILKAGGAYVPLDPQYPAERLAFMLADSQAAVLLTKGPLADGMPAGETRVIRLDGTWAAVIAGQPADNLTTSAGPDNLAYVIYTSGSTGRPKGAMIIHQGLVNYLSWCVDAYQVAKGSGAPVHSSIAFDLTVTSLFSPLLAGRCVVMLKEEQGIEALAASLLNQEEEFSLIKITPAHLEMLNHLLPPDKSEARVRVLVIGGEALRAEILAGWCDPAAGKRLINEYGPTEAVVGCIVFEVNTEGENATGAVGPVLIGRPIANAQVYILDERTELVPVGTPGEIYLGGDGLARGYLNGPDVTAEKFVPHPFARSTGQRLYRSGDLGRYLPSGQIEYLGRADYQVKLRGYRIEPGEIEACLREHERVSDAVVTLHDDASGSGHLIGYVVSAGGPPLPESVLRRHLTARLPEYMIPARLVVLKEFPLTQNGKVDRQALPAPEHVPAQVRDGGREHHSLLEEMLAGIWCDVLGIEHVDVHDNFFDLGGHSLLAVRLISRLREVFEVELTLDDIFEAETLIYLAKRVEDLLTDQQAVKPSPLRRVERDGEIPLSFAQQRLWFLEQLNPGSFAYNLPAAFRLHGKLDVPALAQSLNEMLRRHESLRTTFIATGGRPQQVIAPAGVIDLPIIDLSQLNEEDRRREVVRLITEEARKTFDLTRGPLVRMTLLRLAADEHVMLSTMHHIISDGWSMGVMISEMAALYEAFGAGRESPLVELAIQYADYAVWQRGWLSGEELERQLAYWREQLAGAPPVLELPTDYQRPALQSFEGSTQPLVLPSDLGAQLKSLSRSEGVTLFMTLLAAFAALLSRHSGQSDLVIGVPIAGRTRAEVEDLIGFFVNTLPLRLDLEGDPSFLTLLRRVRRATLNAYAHQDIPFEKLVEELQPARDRSRSPLFQVAFVWNNLPREALAVRELEMTSMDAGGQTAKFDLTLSLTENFDGTVTGDIEYVTELFDAATIHRMTAHFQSLLAAVSSNPEKRLSEISLLTSGERKQFVEWNDTRRIYSEQGFLPELFAAQVERTPDAVAVVSEDEQVTYAELNRRANRLARYLRGLRVAPDILVGIMAERSVEMVVGLLGILKAGGAYVPFDPSDPQERLSFMLHDSGVPVLLTQLRHLGQLSGYAGVIISLDVEDEAIAREQPSNPISNVSAENLAYVIYASGSTGRPKGAMNTHGAIRNRLLWMQDTYELSAEDRVLQKSPFNFDVSVWEFFWPLLTGARLVMARPGGHRDCAYLRSLITEQQITTLHFVPSMLQAFLDEARLEGVDCLKRVVCSGETLSNELQERFFARLGAAELDNLYGPIETAVDVSFWACERDNGRGSVPIGRPIANTEFYILDGKRRLVPVGVVGELYIGGAGLARGYLGRPDLTGERFVPHPFSKEAGARLYRTEDLARYRADGALEFAGHMDHQVKIRGFRMELGEIETVLGEHAGVSEAVVVASENDAGEKRLVAYVVAEDSLSLSAAELRRHAQRYLPEYMVPSAFVLLNELPLTATGKIDRRALPDPGQERPDLETAFAGPRTPFEEKLGEIWTDLLRIDRIGVHDNFFELGGHSLLATQLVSRIREAFQVDLPLQVLFEFSTINELTKAITTARAAREDTSEVAELLEHLKQLSPDDVKLMLNADGQQPPQQTTITRVTRDGSEAFDESRTVIT